MKHACLAALLFSIFTVSNAQICRETLFTSFPAAPNAGDGVQWYVNNCIQTADGQIVCVANPYQGRIFFLDAQGKILDEKPAPLGEYLIPLSDGFLVAGDFYAPSSTTEYSGFGCARLNTMGDTLWSFGRTNVGWPDLYLSGFMYLPQDSTIILGGNERVYRLNLKGALLTEITMPTPLIALFANTNGTFSLFSSSVGAGSMEMARLDAAFTPIWKKSFPALALPQDFFDRSISPIRQNPQTGNFLIMAQPNLPNSGLPSQLVEINPDGNIVFSSVFPGAALHTANWIGPEIWLGLAVANQSQILRLDANGNKVGMVDLGTYADSLFLTRFIIGRSPDAVLIGGVKRLSTIYTFRNFLWFTSCKSTGTIVSATDDNWRIYPNPSAGILNIEGPNPGETVLVKLSNIQGKIVYTEGFDQHASFSRQIQLPPLASGLYFLILQSKNGQLFSQKVFIQP